VKEMSVIVKTLAKLLFPFTMMFGLYLVIHGHLTPGGGFQGGAVMASGLALMLVAYGRKRVVKKTGETILPLLGLVLFVLGSVEFSNFALGSHAEAVAFGPNAGALLTAGTIPVFSLGVGIEVLLGLGLILLMLAMGVEE